MILRPKVGTEALRTRAVEAVNDGARSALASVATPGMEPAYTRKAEQARRVLRTPRTPHRLIPVIAAEADATGLSKA